MTHENFDMMAFKGLTTTIQVMSQCHNPEWLTLTENEMFERICWEYYSFRAKDTILDTEFIRFFNHLCQFVNLPRFNDIPVDGKQPLDILKTLFNKDFTIDDVEALDVSVQCVEEIRPPSTTLDEAEMDALPSIWVANMTVAQNHGQFLADTVILVDRPDSII